MSQNLGRRLAILRLIPIILLVILAFGLDYVFNVDKVVAVIIALVVAVGARLVLMKVWK